MLPFCCVRLVGKKLLTLKGKKCTDAYFFVRIFHEIKCSFGGGKAFFLSHLKPSPFSKGNEEGG